MTWGAHCARCGREDCSWECGGTCEGSAVGAFDLDRALLDCALENIAVRALERRREAIHDALLLAGVSISLFLAAFGAILLFLMVTGRL